MTLLPLLSGFFWVLALRRWTPSALEAALAGLLLFGLIVSLATELQSLSGSLTRGGAAIAWIIASIPAVVIARTRRPAVAPRPNDVEEVHRAELAPAVLFLSLTAVVALVTAPNSYDGLTYHLVRVERWIQQGSLQPFATHNLRQVFMPSWPEYAILQFRLLSGGDRLANFAQWLGFAGACGGAALLAHSLGGRRKAAVMAATLVATLPMAVSQASGTQTDVLAACWAVLACAFAYRLLGPSPRVFHAVLSALALGLAVATKQTAALFGAVALVPALAVVFHRGDRRLLAAWGTASLVAVAVVAGPQLARNASVFGDVRGPPSWRASVEMGSRGPMEVGGNMLRNAALHFGTPWKPVNRAVTASVASISRAGGVDPDDPQTTWDRPFRPTSWTTHEQNAPNPLHFILVLGCFAVLAARKGPGIRLLFMAGLIVGFVIFCSQLKWQSYNSRLHTPLLVLGLALAAVELERLSRFGRRGLIVLLTLVALPNALFNHTRPLLSGGPTPLPSILGLRRDLQYFLFWPALAEPYGDIARRIAGSGCKDVGLRTWSDAWEYPVMVQAREAGSQAHFRHVDVSNATAVFLEKSEPPCLLLQIGPNPAVPPEWARRWRLLSSAEARLGRAGIALFAPDS